ncbi:hypothetical protein FUA48_11545 [Flavobacterium alkalisoli]|uniref:DUF4595 domain-containing protein n=1 Tax=Flavobacterium alkalisoli TaxID=2602769 RepID=A0A5B9FZI6_9FLAO|nr:hypothetical protein [Flavobacterium alkalisoli]QEE50187.1 hypothetical protein FUA48_11545 [Flavobacterium alkalisoli]
MKLRLLALSFFIVLLSCSSDDGDDPVNTEKNLLEINITNDYYKFRYEFSGNKLSEIYQYDLNNNLLNAYEYHYSANGILNDIVYLDNLMQPTGTHNEFTYDSQGRMIKDALKALNNEGEEIEDYTEFIYNDDNTITVNDVYVNTVPETKTYHLNSQGIVYKIVSELTGNVDEEEVVYANDCIVSHTKEGYTTTYTYDVTTEVKGHYLKSDLNMFNGNVLNHQLFARGFVNKSYTKYISSVENPFTNVSYTYMFDEDGYPVNRYMYSDNVLLSEETITYE